MAFNGAGTFTVLSPPYPFVAGTVIVSDDMNDTLADLATGLSMAIAKDGQTTITANIPMATFHFTGLGAGSIAGDSVRYEQFWPTFAGSAITLSGTQPATADDSTSVPTTAWVQDRVEAAIVQTSDTPAGDYSKRLATTKFATDLALGVTSSILQLYMFYNA